MNCKKNSKNISSISFGKARAIVLAGSMALTGIMSSPVVSVVHAEEVQTVNNTDKTDDSNKTEKSETKTDKTVSSTDAKADEVKDLIAGTEIDTPNIDTTKSTEKVNADYTINMDDTRNVQLTSIVATVASKVDEATTAKQTQSTSNKKALKNAISNISDNSVIGQTLSGVREVKDEVNEKKSKKTELPQGVIPLESEDSYSYLYGDYLVQIKDLDVNKAGAQEAKVEMSKLSATDKQVLSLAASKNVNADKALKGVKKTGKVSENVMIQMDDVSGPQINFSDASTTLAEGDSFDIKNYVASVHDIEDGDVDYTVDGSVDTSKTGDYTVNVIARDSAGNVTTKPLSIHVETKAQAQTQNQATAQQSQANTNVSVAADGSTASIIANAAIAQIGVGQDCTMLVTNSLKAAGINFHGWPYQYSCLGSWTNNPVPGDIIIYSGHVAIYIGNGMAIHGGWYGYGTVKYTVACGNPLIGYIHVGG